MRIEFAGIRENPKRLRVLDAAHSDTDPVSDSDTGRQTTDAGGL